MNNKITKTEKAVALFGSALFLVLAPGIVAGLIPWLISEWKVQAPLINFTPLRVVGVLLVAASILVLLESFVRFALQGGGTPAPVAPTRHLVVTGLYRHVRNPMYLAVASAIFGQSMILGSLSLLAYGGLVWFITNLFVLGYEEPTLRKTYGAEYEAFYANVPRWIPRFRPWTGSTTPR